MKAIITFIDKNRYLDDTQEVCVGEEVIVGIENVITDHMTPAQMLALKAFISIKETIESVKRGD